MPTWSTRQRHSAIVRRSTDAPFASALCLVAATIAFLTGGCAPPEPPPRFTLVSDDVVRDTRSELEWTRRDGERSFNWSAADEHCRALGLAGGGWRLPEITELEALYDKAQRQPCGGLADCRLDAAIDLTGPWVWSATAPYPGTPYYIDFQFGTKFYPGTPPSLVRRVLCVRAGR
jgi:hypothetical protein